MQEDRRVIELAFDSRQINQKKNAAGSPSGREPNHTLSVNL
jgi:hypothetical protein